MLEKLTRLDVPVPPMLPQALGYKGAARFVALYFDAEIGEATWLKMLDKAAQTVIRPRFVLLPDVVGNWTATLERAHHYRREVNDRRLPCALALQDGAEFDNYRAAINFAPSTVFIGGSTRWKWTQARRIAILFPLLHISVHLGRVNGEKAIRCARGLNLSSCDGTGISRHADAMMPGFQRGFSMPAAQFGRKL